MEVHSLSRFRYYNYPGVMELPELPMTFLRLPETASNNDASERDGLDLLIVDVTSLKYRPRL